MATLYFMGNPTETQMLGILIRTKGGHVLLFDGGTFAGAPALAELIRTEAGGRVDAWFFTHPHHDHLGAFAEISAHNPEISVGRVYAHFPPVADIADTSRFAREVSLWQSLPTLIGPPSLQAGDRITIDEVTVRVLQVYDPSITRNIVNNSSTVFRVEGSEKSLLVLGDLGVEGGDRLLRSVPLTELTADYTQMAHHGQGGVSREFYEQTRPTCCLWPTPDWLWDNDHGDGFDSGPYATVRTREWMAAIGVTHHVVQKDGTVALPL